MGRRQAATLGLLFASQGQAETQARLTAPTGTKPTALASKPPAKKKPKAPAAVAVPVLSGEWVTHSTSEATKAPARCGYCGLAYAGNEARFWQSRQWPDVIRCTACCAPARPELTRSPPVLPSVGE